ncbi:hypothetical protein [Halalkalibacter sp. APA_J-10(15)]|uniref:hypothetical protein n=1 Tax=Halalkalibacter sp. APA_J-10(15) TaxID=2933805 RepID=UPI001FF10A73|nr:hypothetical protein [Halalkalibacter sp. APA_J-10(15)]MCK0473045.1 hypothetical protein [Halalkalibacter sp. APA_J-10(15)]
MSIEMAFSSVKLINKNNRKLILKSAEKNELQTTVEQIEYLNNLPSSLKKYFPNVIDYTISSEMVQYLMPYYDMTQLDVALSGKEVPYYLLEKVLSNLISIVFQEIYPLNKIIPPDNYMYEKHFNRVISRIDYLLFHRKDLVNIIKAPYLKINQKTYMNFYNCINKVMDKDHINSISPIELSLIHGDLEANHIMFKEKDKKLRIKLLDPRVSKNGGDFAYDLAKLFQSVHGQVHEIQRGNFCLEIKSNMHCPEVNFSIHNCRDIDELKKLLDVLRIDVNQYSFDKSWEQRTMFIESIHFLSSPPFFLSEKFPPFAAEALYIQGIILLNNYVNKYLD